ncbi:IclR family transcriptional regulator [Microbacterium lacus]|uniref:IclR family transcriptional regulator n=1 Tax=Microbacterium lacus TaxID=415217 RepID=UPI00384F0D8F
MDRKFEPVQSVQRALTIITLVLDEGSVSVSEAASALNVNPSTAYRLLGTLALQGFVLRGDQKRYSVGPVLRFDHAAFPQPSLAMRLRPALEQLYERTGETVHIATLAGTQIQHLDGIEATSHSLRFGLRVGVWLPAHRTSAGKVLLAELPDAEINARYKMAMASPRGRRIDVDLASLHEQIDDVRDTRIGWNFEESEPGIAAMAIATGDLGGQRAAISISLPIARFTHDKGRLWAAELIRLVDELRSSSSPSVAVETVPSAVDH